MNCSCNTYPASEENSLLARGKKENSLLARGRKQNSLLARGKKEKSLLARGRKQNSLLARGKKAAISKQFINYCFVNAYSTYRNATYSLCF